jgi:hypothetical protein
MRSSPILDGLNKQRVRSNVAVARSPDQRSAAITRTAVDYPHVPTAPHAVQNSQPSRLITV